MSPKPSGLLARRPNPRAFDFIVAGALAAIIAVSSAVISVRYMALQRLADDQARVAHGYLTQKVLGEVIAVFRSAEFQERTYRASGAELAKKAFADAVRQMPAVLTELHGLVADNLLQDEAARRLDAMINKRLAILEQEAYSNFELPIGNSYLVRDEEVVGQAQGMIDAEQAIVQQWQHSLYERMSLNLVYMVSAVTAALASIAVLVVWMFRHLAMRIRIQKQLAEAKDEAEKARFAAEEARERADTANRAKSLFLANISHEIRTPLNAIMGFSELMAEITISPGERTAAVATIQRNCRLLNQIIDDTLDLAKIEAGKMQIELMPCDLAEVLEDVAILLRRRAEEKGLTLALRSDGDVPPRIQTDPTRLKQILINIIGNAVKFTAAGRIDVVVQQAPGSTPGRCNLAFLVRDTGAGIRLDAQDKLFQPFTQADASTTRQFGGTGLGLVLSRQLARALGGDVALLQSRPGEGTTFQISIQADVVAPSRDVAAALPTVADAKAQVKPAVLALSGMRILVAEDSPDNRALMARLLGRAGATVDFATNGVEAVALGLSAAYDVILMDLQMPIQDGYEATAELRRRGFKGPIVALSATVLPEDLARCFAAGCNDSIAKPISGSALIQRVERFRTAAASANSET